MKVGIKKLQGDEWQVHIGCARVKMDRFSLELLNSTLEHLTMLKSGQSHSNVKSYIKLGLRLDDLDDRALQKVLSSLDSKEVLILLLAVKKPDFTQKVLKNIGGILSKQLQADLEVTELPDEDQVKRSIQHIVETLFSMEANGQIEIVKNDTKYI